jgi:uncharacterized membrane protein YoaK (UPF0700 family)
MGMVNATMEGAGDRVRGANRVVGNMRNLSMGRATGSMPRDAE